MVALMHACYMSPQSPSRPRRPAHCVFLHSQVHLKHAGMHKTPDILLTIPICVKGKAVHWIDSKVQAIFIPLPTRSSPPAFTLPSRRRCSVTSLVLSSCTSGSWVATKRAMVQGECVSLKLSCVVSSCLTRCIIHAVYCVMLFSPNVAAWWYSGLATARASTTAPLPKTSRCALPRLKSSRHAPTRSPLQVVADFPDASEITTCALPLPPNTQYCSFAAHCSMQLPGEREGTA